MGLHLTRTPDEAIDIGTARVTVEEIQGQTVRLHIEAPPGVSIDRVDNPRRTPQRPNIEIGYMGDPE